MQFVKNISRTHRLYVLIGLGFVIVVVLIWYLFSPKTEKTTLEEPTQKPATKQNAAKFMAIKGTDKTSAFKNILMSDDSGNLDTASFDDLPFNITTSGEIRIINGSGVPNTQLNYQNTGVNWISGNTNFRNGNITSTGSIASNSDVTAKSTGVGSVSIKTGGDGNKAGFIEFKKSDGVRNSYIGFSDTNNNTELFAEASAGFSTNKNFRVGQDLSVGQNLTVGQVLNAKNFMLSTNDTTASFSFNYPNLYTDTFMTYDTNRVLSLRPHNKDRCEIVLDGQNGAINIKGILNIGNTTLTEDDVKLLKKLRSGFKFKIDNGYIGTDWADGNLYNYGNYPLKGRTFSIE